MFVGKARSLQYKRALERCSTQVGSSLTSKHYTRLERPARDRHWLILPIVSNEEKKVLKHFGWSKFKYTFK
jgi:hypothetical protein